MEREKTAAPRTASKVAIITGAASGIGRALAEALAARGVEIVLADRQVALAEDVAGGIARRGGTAAVVELDVVSHAQVHAVVHDTVARTGRLDYLFNNAGISVSGEMKDYTLADWTDVLDVNLRGVVHGVHAAYPIMVRQGFGHIVNTASMAGLVANGYLGSYVVTKHAVVGLSKALRIEAKEYGVQVSVLCPGLIRTPIIEGGRYGRLKDDLDMEGWRRSLERLRPLDAPVLAERALRAITRNRAIIVVPGWWRLFWYLDRLSPPLAERAFGALYQSGKREIATLRRTPS
jgi:NAD(P)-dependent dehydrogenase (short-subunit alcohol dehydrogenase family)